MVYLYNNLGRINYNRLMPDQALANYKQALELARETDFDEGIIFSNFNLSEFYREEGKLKSGRTCLKASQHIAKLLDLKYAKLDCLTEEIDYLLLERKLKKADEISARLRSQTKFEHALSYRIFGLIYRAKVLVAKGEYYKAHRYYNNALGFIKSLPDNNNIAGEIYYLKAIAYKKEKRLKETQKMFLKANQIFDAIGNLRYLDKIEKEIFEV